MRDLYATPEVEVITFSTEDVITTSNPTATVTPDLPFDEL